MRIIAISLLAQEVCGSLYSINSALGSSVTSAIASATASAVAAVASKDPTSISSYPECAVSQQYLGSRHEMLLYHRSLFLYSPLASLSK